MASVHEKAKAFDEIVAAVFKGRTETGWLTFEGQESLTYAPIIYVDPKRLPCTVAILKEQSR